MGDTEKGNIDLLRSLESFSNHQMLANTNPDVSQLNLSEIQPPMRQNLQNLFRSGPESVRRMHGLPPSHPPMPPASPYSQIPANRPASQQMNLQNFGHTHVHSRSLSQPPIFNFDSTENDAIALQENSDANPNSMLSPLPPSGGGVGSSSAVANRDGLPPRKLHRRSMSDVPFGFSSGLFQSPPLPPMVPHDSHGGLQRTLSGGQCDSSAKPAQLIKKEVEKNLDGESMDDLLKAYMNLDSIDNKSNQEDMDCRASNSKLRGSDNSDNDTESSANESGCSGNMKEGLKRSAGGDIAPTPTVRHQRSISMDSFMGNLQLNDDFPNLQPSAASALAGEASPGLFSGSELEKIMANEKLAEIAMNDPKRVKRILANRQSAARSKERKMRYITELEHKVQTLQNEATTLNAQLTMLQKDSQELTSLNTELKLRLLAFEQQSQIRNALNDALTQEIQRLRIVAGEIADYQSRGSNSIAFADFQMLLQQMQVASAQETSDSTIKSESNSSLE